MKIEHASKNLKKELGISNLSNDDLVKELSKDPKNIILLLRTSSGRNRINGELFSLLPEDIAKEAAQDMLNKSLLHEERIPESFVRLLLNSNDNELANMLKNKFPDLASDINSAIQKETSAVKIIEKQKSAKIFSFFSRA